MPTVVELRCVANPLPAEGRLLGRIQSDSEPTVVPGNLIEVACRDCKRARVRDGEAVYAVLHRFNVAGELVETEVVPSKTP
jgi:hypothetical protein